MAETGLAASRLAGEGVEPGRGTRRSCGLHERPACRRGGGCRLSSASPGPRPALASDLTEQGYVRLVDGRCAPAAWNARESSLSSAKIDAAVSISSSRRHSSWPRARTGHGDARLVVDNRLRPPAGGSPNLCRMGKPTTATEGPCQIPLACDLDQRPPRLSTVRPVVSIPLRPRPRQGRARARGRASALARGGRARRRRCSWFSAARRARVIRAGGRQDLQRGVGVTVVAMSRPSAT